MNDFDFQLGFVAQNAWRLLSMQDRALFSPGFGCFHCAYWRDKTSEFPDARFQEAGAALGLLSLPVFDPLRSSEGLPEPSVLLQAFAAGLANLSSQQYPAGCFDEWYKGERGYAATEFPMIAYGLTGIFLRDILDPDTAKTLSNLLTQAGDWLCGRVDRVKSNHEAAGAAALALAWRVTGQGRFRQAAEAKLAETLSRQTTEGWFPEVGGMDLGYCSVLLDYAMLTIWALGRDTQGAVRAMGRLLDFMLPHIQPDMTISPEAGLCLNPYVSRLGFVLLARHNSVAASLVQELAVCSPKASGLTPTLGDDLRLCRWSYLPVATRLLLDESLGVAVGPPLEAAYPQGWTFRHKALVASYHKGGSHVFFSPAGGGMVRVFQGRNLLYEDPGLGYVSPEGPRTCLGYDPKRTVEAVNGGYWLVSELTQPSFFYPGLLSRLVLRLGCIFAFTSRALRAFIDWRRIRTGTAVNQSAAPVSRQASGIRLERSVTVHEASLVITDRLVAAEELAAADVITWDPLLADALASSPVRSAPGGALVITRTLDWHGAKPFITLGVTDPQKRHTA